MIALPSSAYAKPLGAMPEQRPVHVSNVPKGFDLLAIDSQKHRLLAAHTKAGTLSIIDLNERQPLAEVPVGEAADVAVDKADNDYLVSTTKGVVLVDRTTLKKAAEIPTEGPADAVAFDTKDDLLFVGHDDAKEIWVMDPRQRRVVSHIAISGAPEIMQIDPSTRRLYVNIKTENKVAVIDLRTDKVTAYWSTDPTVSPHGLALDMSSRRLFVAGRSEFVSIFSLDSGKKLGTIDVGPGHIDQIAYDPVNDTLYCPDNGRLIVVTDASRHPTVSQSLAIPKKTHSATLDPQTRAVWIAYADSHGSFVRPLSPRG